MRAACSKRRCVLIPGSSIAHGWLAYWHLLYVGQGWAPDPAASSAEAARLAEHAVMLDPGDARAMTLAGHVRGFLGRHPDEAMALHERAIKLNPNLAIAWCFSGLSHVYCGQHDEGLRRIHQALRLSPSDPHVFFFDMSLTIVHLLLGDYASAIEAGRRATELNPLFSSAHKSYLAALGLMNRPQEAARALVRLLDLEPGFSVGGRGAAVPVHPAATIWRATPRDFAVPACASAVKLWRHRRRCKTITPLILRRRHSTVRPRCEMGRMTRGEWGMRRLARIGGFALLTGVLIRRRLGTPGGGAGVRIGDARCGERTWAGPVRVGR